MPKYIDLSYTIEAELSVHPFDNEVKLYQDKFLDVDGYNNSRLEAECMPELILIYRDTS